MNDCPPRCSPSATSKHPRASPHSTLFTCRNDRHLIWRRAPFSKRGARQRGVFGMHAWAPPFASQMVGRRSRIARAPHQNKSAQMSSRRERRLGRFVLVVDAVRCEPISTSNSHILGKIQRNVPRAGATRGDICPGGAAPGAMGRASSCVYQGTRTGKFLACASGKFAFGQKRTLSP